MMGFIPKGYLDIDKVIDIVGESLFPDCWNVGLANKSLHIDFLNPEQKEFIKGILDGNHSNKETILISISNCRLATGNPSHTYPSPPKNIEFCEVIGNFDPENQDAYKIMCNFYKLQEARDQTRTALSSGKLLAYYLSEKDGKKTPLEADLWNVDENWHLLLLIHSIYIGQKDYKLINGIDQWITSPRGKVVFGENNVEDFLLSDKKMDSSYDGILVGQLLKGIKDGTFKLRGTEKLYLKAKNKFYEEEIQAEYSKGENKGKLETIIANIAKDMALTTIRSLSETFPNRNKMTREQLDQMNQSYVTEAEIKDIAKLIRPLHQQKS